MDERECPFCHKMVWAYNKYCQYCNMELPPWYLQDETEAEKTELKEDASYIKEEPLIEEASYIKEEPKVEEVPYINEEPKLEELPEEQEKEENTTTYSQPAHLYQADKEDGESKDEGQHFKNKSKKKDMSQGGKSKKNRAKESMYQNESEFDLDEYLRKNNITRDESFQRNADEKTKHMETEEEREKRLEQEAFREENPFFEENKRSFVSVNGTVNNYANNVTTSKSEDYLDNFLVADYELFVGKRFKKYLKKFKKVSEGKITFNWACFFFRPFWFAYRKMMLKGLCIETLFGLVMNILAYPLISKCCNMALNAQNYTRADGIELAKKLTLFSGITTLIGLAYALLFGFLANKIYFKTVKRRMSELGLKRRKKDSAKVHMVKISNTGGTSVGRVILLYFLMGIIGGIIFFIMYGDKYMAILQLAISKSR